MAPSTAAPEPFARAVAGLRSVVPRSEIILEDMTAPQGLAAYSFALGGIVARDGEEGATGRLVLLHDPAGHEAWGGTLRLVTYVTAEIEPQLATDPLLPAVGWSWLTDALSAYEADYTAIGGTVTPTTSTRFRSPSAPPRSADLEIRASWTPLTDDIAAHLESWCALLASTA